MVAASVVMATEFPPSPHPPRWLAITEPTPPPQSFYSFLWSYWALFPENRPCNSDEVACIQ